MLPSGKVRDLLLFSLCAILSIMACSGSTGSQSSPSMGELSSYHCGTCDKSVTSYDRGVACEGCGQWFHADCQSIGDSYERLGDSDVIWRCLVCDCANYSMTAFDLYSMGNTTDFLDQSSPPPQNSHSFKPFHTSTPTRQTRQNKWKNRPLRFLNVNARSSTKNFPGMLNLIETTKPDVIIATETRLDNCIKDTEFLPPTYKVYRCDRNREGGGCYVAVADHLKSSLVPELSVPGCELVWTRIKLKGNKDLLAAAYYKPDDGDEDSLDRFCSSLERVSTQSSYMVIGGDFNLPSFDWTTCSLKSPCVYPKIHNKFLDFLNDKGLQQMVTFPTRDRNTLDLFLTNYPTLVPRVEGVPGISDHFAVYLEFQTQPERRNNTNRRIPCYNKADWPNLRSAAKDLSDKILLTYKDTMDHTEEIWTSLKEGLHQLVQDHVPHTSPKTKFGKPWVDYRSKRLIRKRDRAFKKWKKSGDPVHLKRLKELKNQVQRQLRRNYWNFTANLLEENQESRKVSKGFWSYIKSRRTEPSNVSPLKSDGKLITDAQGQAEVLNQQFQSAFSKSIHCTAEDFERRTGLSTSPSGPTCTTITITEAGVRKLLTNLDVRKAPGPDGISPRILKELAEEITPCLTMLFQSSIDTGTVPQDWRTAHVTPIFKKGERYRPENYRPISLTSIPGKLLEHIIVHTIMSFAENNNIICREQHGFRKRRSCVSQLLGLMDEITHSREKGKQTDMLVMDFSKAFDKVSHTLLTHKLQHYGITGKINNWIESFLSNRRQAVVVDGVTSKFVPVESGVPQGSVLGPCLFILYINDLPRGLTSTVRLFADDTACHRNIIKPADQQALQADLDMLADWEAKWMMSFHPDKCEVLHFGNRWHTNYHLREHTLKTSNSTKYLGVTISTDLNWKQHVTQVALKANKTLCFLRRNLKIGSISTKACAYKALVRPQLEYASQVWDPYTENLTSTLEKVQRRAARWVVNNHHKTTSVADIYKQLNWTPLEVRRERSRLDTFIKYHSGEMKIDTSAAPTRCLPRHNTRNSHDQQYSTYTWYRNYRKFSFFPRTVKLFNELSPEATTPASLVSL